VFVIEAMAMHHVKPGVFVEPGADRKDAGLDHALVTVHGRCRRVGIVDRKLVGAGAQSGRRIKVLDHLKVIDVDMDGMLVVVVVDDHSSTELSRGWISGTFGNAPPSNAYTNALGSSVLAKLLRNPPDIRICRLTSGMVLARSTKDV